MSERNLITGGQRPPVAHRKIQAMPQHTPPRIAAVDRRDFLRTGLGGLALAALPGAAARAADEPSAKTDFQIACMTLPYAQFPLARALEGIKSAGYRYVAWGTTHREADGKEVPLMAADAATDKAKQLGQRCRDMGLAPLMMFSTVYPEQPGAPQVLRQRVLQAEAAGIPQVLTFGHTQGGNRKLWVERFKELGPVARDHGVLIVVKQHGGSTGTGEACAEIIREVDDPGIKVNYDAGNVMDYLNLDPLDDIKKCAAELRSFCIKDHRNFPVDEDCGPGFGEIDHYKLLANVAFTGRSLPLCCENISAPLLPRPAMPEGIDSLARRAREFLEVVVEGLGTNRG
jgi:sugar phosphate isomerase/epimerase